MKVLFLDFDGVLNSERYVANCGEFGVIIDPYSMSLLKRIISETRAEIVLTTSWREHWGNAPADCDETGEKINKIFAEKGLHIFGKTPKLGRREEEIEVWLKAHPETENFVVLDDRFLYSETIKNHFIKTDNFKRGLSETNTYEAIRILRGE